jgi:hypothetical protein
MKDLVHAQQISQSSTNRQINFKYTQHLFGSQNIPGILTQSDSPGITQIIPNVSTIHLPPLITNNANKFIERQRRTQVLQRQRLKKEYFN